MLLVPDSSSRIKVLDPAPQNLSACFIDIAACTNYYDITHQTEKNSPRISYGINFHGGNLCSAIFWVNDEGKR